MVGSLRSCSTVMIPFAVASALLIGAIFVRPFWLSLALGIAGLTALAFGVLGFRQASKGMLDSPDA